MFPYLKDLPSVGPEHPPDLDSPLDVPGYLGPPEPLVSLGHLEVFLATMPEAPIHEDRCVDVRNGEVWPAPHHLGLVDEAECPGAVLEDSQHLPFGARVLPSDPGHDVGSELARQFGINAFIVFNAMCLVRFGGTLFPILTHASFSDMNLKLSGNDAILFNSFATRYLNS